jgi:hypothetical protein
MTTTERAQFSRRIFALAALRQGAKTPEERRVAGERILHMMRLLALQKSKLPHT